MLMDEVPARDPLEKSFDKSTSEVPQKRFMQFVEKMIAKSARLIEVNGGYYQVVEMSAAAICHTFTMINVFVCLEHSMSKHLLAYADLSDFPLHPFFIRECSEFDQSLADSECLGGTLSFLEQELKPKIAHFKQLKLSAGESKLFKKVQIMIRMFTHGLLDQISNFQGILEKIFIKHRAMDDLDLKNQ
jgi:hypothetical protein